jgi:mRNA interferase RelE/StbE
MLISFQESALKDLKKIDKTEAKKILEAIKKLEYYPLVFNIKKLTNYYPPYRFRIGNYRVLFDIEDENIYISFIKHRKEAY